MRVHAQKTRSPAANDGDGDSSEGEEEGRSEGKVKVNLKYQVNMARAVFKRRQNRMEPPETGEGSDSFEFVTASDSDSDLIVRLCDYAQAASSSISTSAPAERFGRPGRSNKRRRFV